MARHSGILLATWDNAINPPHVRPTSSSPTTPAEPAVADVAKKVEPATHRQPKPLETAARAI
jgi:hypothetical protein